MKTQLAIHEWLAIVVISALALLFAFLAFLDREPSLPNPSVPRKMTPPTITVTIHGAVAKPGAYEIPTGSTIADLLALSEPLPNANLKKINQEAHLRHGRNLLIPEQPTLTIYLKGAVVQTGPMQVKKGTKLNELVGMIELLKDADTTALKGNHRLRDQETIDIPFR